MTPEQFMGCFGAVAEAEGGINCIRELVLRLAIRGRLVEQRPEEGVGADALIDRLQASDSGPFHIPSQWSWALLPSVAPFEIGRTPSTKDPKYWDPNGVPWVSIGDMKHFGIVRETQRSVSVAAAQGPLLGKKVPAGTLLMSFKLTIGKVSILGMDAYCNEAIIALRPRSRIVRDWLFRCLPALNLLQGTASAVKGATLNRKKLEGLLVPVPPLAEQKRIVARVDQLMTMLDNLEQRQAKKRLLAIHVSKTSLDCLVNAEDPDELCRAWEGVSRNFGVVAQGSGGGRRLREAVVSLGVIGVLSRWGSQHAGSGDSCYGEACRLLVDLMRRGEVRRRKLLPLATRTDGPVELPAHWAWARLDHLVSRIEYGTSQKAYETECGIPVLRMGNIHDGKVNLGGLKFIPPETVGIQQLLLARGDILFNRTNSPELVGKSGVFRGGDDQYTFASYLIRIRLLEDCCLADYMNYYLQSALCRRTQIEPGITQQTGQANFSGAKLRNILVPLPPLSEQMCIVETIERLFKAIDYWEVRQRHATGIATMLTSAMSATNDGVDLA